MDIKEVILNCLSFEKLTTHDLILYVNSKIPDVKTTDIFNALSELRSDGIIWSSASRHWVY